MVSATGARISLNLVSAVSPSGEMRFRLLEGDVNGSVFADFLERLARHAGGRVFLIVDGLPMHRSRVVQGKLKQVNGRIEPFFLSPYFPELNLDELVRSHVKLQHRSVGRDLQGISQTTRHLCVPLIAEGAAGSRDVIPAF